MTDRDDFNINEFDQTTPLEYHYYLVGDRPLRIGYIAPHVSVVAEILNSNTKEFGIDNLYLDRAATSVDIISINEKQFVDACLKKGAKPPPDKCYKDYLENK